MSPVTTQLQHIPLTKIIESKWNPRKHFDKTRHEDLILSMKTHGQLTPALARPAGGGKFELAAGHRRLRAAIAAGLDTLECKVVALTDAQLVEVLSIENDEKEDVHPLDQAVGYRNMMVVAGYDVPKIAARLQRSHDFVYDRLILLELNADLKEMFLADRFGMAQAGVLARLSPAEQKRVADPNTGGLFRHSESSLDSEVFPLVANTKAELEEWINDNIRFDETAVQLEEILPETASLLESAAEAGVRRVSITYEDHLRESAKDKDGDRTYTRKFWKRADGLEGSKDCEYAVIGIVRAGEGRGGAMGVCLRRDKCKTHWPAEVKALAEREQEKKTGKKTTEKSDAPKKEQPWQIAERKRQAKEEVAARKRARIKRATPALLEAMIANIGKLALSEVAKFIEPQEHIASEFKKLIPAADGTALSIVLRLAAINLAQAASNTFYFEQDLAVYAKMFSVDVKKILAQFPEPAEDPAKAAKLAAISGEDHEEQEG